MLPDALRVLGIPLGRADSVAEMVIWTVALEPKAFGFLRRRRAQLLWEPKPRAMICSRSDGDAEIDARGGSLLELGPAIFDYVVAQARAGGEIDVRVHRTYGDVFLPYLVWRAAGQGVRVVVTEPTGDERDGGRAAYKRDALSLLACSQQPDPAVTALPEAYLEALRQGIRLALPDFDFLMAQFEMLRVPTSDRSRSHAG